MLGRTNTGGGGGGGLNFRVIGGTSAPASPKENDIWVNTSNKVTGFVFAAVDPSIYETELTCVESLTGQYLNSSGNVYSNSSFNVSDYVELPKTTKKITVYHGTSGSSNMYHAFYNANKTFISSVQRTNTTKEYDVPSNAAYVRLTLCTSGTPDKLTFLATVNDGSVSEGFVWISTGTSSSVEFNALKKNGIQVYPISAKQYVSGVWVDKEAKSYQSGKWVAFLMYLYNAGDEFSTITGGWISEGKKENSGSTSYAHAFEIVRNSSNLYVTYHTDPYSGIIRAKDVIDLTGFSTLIVEGEFKNNSGANNYRLAIWSTIGTYAWDNIVAQTTVPGQSTVNRLEIDITNLPQGKYYVGFAFSTAGMGGNGYIRLDSCYLK